MDTVENMLYCISSLVYTTKLEDMTILKEDLRKKSFKDVIKTITDESKPRYIATQTQPCNSKLGETNDVIFEKLKLECLTYDNDCKVKCIKRKKSSRSQVIIEKRKIKDKEKINKSNSVMSSHSDNDNDRPKIDYNNYYLNKDQINNICKPVRIILTDINKLIPKTIDKSNQIDKPQVVYISSDEDDDVTLKKKDEDSQNTTKKSLNHESFNSAVSTDPGEDLTQLPPSNYIIRNIDKFKKIIEEVDLKNSLIVMYNAYIKDSDVYEISNTYSFKRLTKAQYEKTKSELMKSYSTVYNIIACCWNSRHSYIMLLCKHEKYYDLATVMFKDHQCRKYSCKCCCKPVMTTFHDKLNVSNESENLITAALNFPLNLRKQTKWKPDTTVSACSNDFSKVKLIEIRYKGNLVQTYELGAGDELYSKTVIGPDRPNSIWIRKTQASNKIFNIFSRKQDYLDYLKITDVAHIEHYAEFIQNKYSLDTQNNDSLSTEKPVIANADNMKKNGASNSPLLFDMLNNSHRSLDKFLNYKKRFTGAENENKKVATNSPLLSNTINNNKRLQTKKGDYIKVSSRGENIDSSTTTIPQFYCVINDVKASQSKNVNMQVLGQRNVLTVATSLENITQQTLETENISKDATNTVQSLISNILTKFNDVRLTINADGKVAAALNAPVNNLSSTELSILSEIITCAQKQVDHLGLKPGTCISPNIPPRDPLLISNAHLISNPPSTLISNMTSNTTSTSNAPSTSKGILITDPFSVLSSPSAWSFSLTSNDPLKSNLPLISNSPERKNEINAATENDKGTNCETKILTMFSYLICQRKISYNSSFQQYFKEIRQVLPEITSVYTLSNENSSTTSPNVSKATNFRYNLKIGEEPKKKKRRIGTTKAKED